MQRCPKCNRTYQDDMQKFCTHDGGRLTPYEPPLSEAPTNFDLGATMRTDSSDLGETLLNTAAELNRTMAAPPPPPPSPQLNKTIAAPSATPANIPAASTPPPQQPQPPSRTVAAPPPAQQTPPPPPSQQQQPQMKTMVAPPPPAQSSPPPQSPATGGMRPTSAMPNSSPTSELPRPQATTGFPPPQAAPPPAASQHPAASQPSPSWQPAPPASPAAPRQPSPTAPSGNVGQFSPLGQTTQPVSKPNRLPLILGGVVVLLLLVAGVTAAAYFMYFNKSETKEEGRPGLSSNISTNTNDNVNTSANTNTGSSASNTSSTFEAPPNSLKFNNSRANLDGKLAEHYVDFSFYYPRLWTLDPKAGVPGANNFVKVDRIIPPNLSQERFVVGWYDSLGTMMADRSNFPNLVQRFNNDLTRTFPEYQKVSEGNTEINAHEGYEFRFQSVARGTDKGDITYWGRVVFMPPGTEGEKNGLVLLMFTTSVAANLNGVEDVGKKGELAMIMDTFRFSSNP